MSSLAILAVLQAMSVPTGDTASVQVPQLSTAETSRDRVTQIGGTDRPNVDLSAEPIGGRDRCQDQPLSPGCRQSLDATAGQLVRADPTRLSADQTTAAKRQIMPRTDVADTARRAGRAQLDPLNATDQSVAAVAHRPTAPATPPADDGLSSLQRAIEAGVILPADVTVSSGAPK